jgi:drug/metabolite transporter (DMT)-like permease
MNLAARFLELEGQGMHPFQILFARMGLTTILSCIYMYKTKVPHFPLGPREVRWLLVARGLSGFFGIYGIWYSIMYLPLAEATVITFLAPSVSGYICHVLLHDPFTRKEQMASFVALAGVIFIARPTALFASSQPSAVDVAVAAANATTPETHLDLGQEATPSQRLIAIGVALMGVLGASGAFTTIRWIGKRAHPLISVNYFSTWCTIVSLTVLLVAPALDIGQPEIRFALPSSIRQWLLLIFLGVCGFIMQFMLTSGIGGEKSNRATAMVYTQMLFAAGFDKWIFGHEMGALSLVGCGLIVGSALWVALTKKEPEGKRPGEDVEARAAQGPEAVPMLADEPQQEPIQLDEVRRPT